eukprot:4353914-Alexandrium_andersonii.AAC.1
MPAPASQRTLPALVSCAARVGALGNAGNALPEQVSRGSLGANARAQAQKMRASGKRPARGQTA